MHDVPAANVNQLHSSHPPQPSAPQLTMATTLTLTLTLALTPTMNSNQTRKVHMGSLVIAAVVSYGGR